jgi:hypothetical protein
MYMVECCYESATRAICSDESYLLYSVTCSLDNETNHTHSSAKHNII